jgi:hypothetical protein
MKLCDVCGKDKKRVTECAQCYPKQYICSGCFSEHWLKHKEEKDSFISKLNGQILTFQVADITNITHKISKEEIGQDPLNESSIELSNELTASKSNERLYKFFEAEATNRTNVDTKKNNDHYERIEAPKTQLFNQLQRKAQELLMKNKKSYKRSDVKQLVPPCNLRDQEAQFDFMHNNKPLLKPPSLTISKLPVKKRGYSGSRSVDSASSPVCSHPVVPSRVMSAVTPNSDKMVSRSPTKRTVNESYEGDTPPSPSQKRIKAFVTIENDDWLPQEPLRENAFTTTKSKDLDSISLDKKLMPPPRPKKEKSIAYPSAPVTSNQVTNYTNDTKHRESTVENSDKEIQVSTTTHASERVYSYPQNLVKYVNDHQQKLLSLENKYNVSVSVGSSNIKIRGSDAELEAVESYVRQFIGNSVRLQRAPKTSGLLMSSAIDPKNEYQVRLTHESYLPPNSKKLRLITLETQDHTLTELTPVSQSIESLVHADNFLTFCSDQNKVVDFISVLIKDVLQHEDNVTMYLDSGWYSFMFKQNPDALSDLISTERTFKHRYLFSSIHRTRKLQEVIEGKEKKRVCELLIVDAETEQLYDVTLYLDSRVVVQTNRYASVGIATVPVDQVTNDCYDSRVRLVTQQSVVATELNTFLDSLTIDYDTEDYKIDTNNLRFAVRAFAFFEEVCIGSKPTVEFRLVKAENTVAPCVQVTVSKAVKEEEIRVAVAEAFAALNKLYE